MVITVIIDWLGLQPSNSSACTQNCWFKFYKFFFIC